VVARRPRGNPAHGATHVIRERLVQPFCLLRLFDRSDPEFPHIRKALHRLRAESERLVTSTQNLAEFWSVSTRPAAARGGYGVSIELAARRLAFLEKLAEILPDDIPAFDDWKRLIVNYRVQGAQVHDARIAALMRASGIPRILTLNIRDFARFSGITPVTPEELATMQ
jgi:predicted nucleic acid-binding protein